jgi:hypothetical protein
MVPLVEAPPRGDLILISNGLRGMVQVGDGWCHVRALVGLPSRKRDIVGKSRSQKKYQSLAERFEVNGANLARVFLETFSVSEALINVLWDAIVSHTTSGIAKWTPVYFSLQREGRS